MEYLEEPVVHDRKLSVDESLQAHKKKMTLILEDITFIVYTW